MTCANCERLEEEVAFLREELGHQAAQTARRDLALRLGVTPGELALLSALHRAQGRVVSLDFLEEILPAPQRNAGERTLKLIQVHVCRLRKVLGFDAVETVWGQGYRLSPKGVAILDGAQAAMAQGLAA